jgi:signal transduction histidine kinase
LAIVSRLARRYDGSFTLANRDGGGLRALLTLPDARASAVQEAA